MTRGARYSHINARFNITQFVSRMYLQGGGNMRTLCRNIWTTPCLHGAPSSCICKHLSYIILYQV